VATKDGSAEIVNMEAARTRLRASELNPNDYPSAGAHLRAVREAAGLSLEEMSFRTNVKASFLDSIEKMTLDKLPSRPFAIGFAKVYADALGVESSALVARFKADAGYTAPVETQVEKFEAAEAAADASDPERPNLSLLAVGFVLAFILWCAWQITMPRAVKTPYNLDPTAEAASGEEAQAAPPPGIVLGVEPAPMAIIVEPILIEKVDPIYPTRCENSAAKVELVELAFNVTMNGVIAGERVASSSNPCFNDAALNAARRWRYSPKMVNGAAKPAYDLRYTFSFERPR
jgi:TonB family protein